MQIDNPLGVTLHDMLLHFLEKRTNPVSASQPRYTKAAKTLRMSAIGLPTCTAAPVGAAVEPAVEPPAVVAAALVDAGPVEVVLELVSVAMLMVVLRCMAVPVAAELPPDATMPVPGRSAVVVIVELLVELLPDAVPLPLGTTTGVREVAEVVEAEDEVLDADVAEALVPPLRANMPE